jgi:hypothetical protein
LGTFPVASRVSVPAALEVPVVQSLLLVQSVYVTVPVGVGLSGMTPPTVDVSYAEAPVVSAPLQVAVVAASKTVVPTLLGSVPVLRAETTAGEATKSPAAIAAAEPTVIAARARDKRPRRT